MSSADGLSYSLRIAGDYLYNPTILGGYFVGSNGGVSIDVTSIRGGKFENNRVSHTTQYGLNLIGKHFPQNEKMVFSKNNFISESGLGKISVPYDDAGNYAFDFGDSTPNWVTSTSSTLDASGASAFTFNSVSPVTIKAITNTFPGRELSLTNYGIGFVIIDGTLTLTGAPIKISQFKTELIKSSGYPKMGKWTVFGSRTMCGSFRLISAATQKISDSSISAGSVILFVPTNKEAAVIMAGPKKLYISSKTAGASFSVTTADGTPANGTEMFDYVIIHP